MDWLSDVIGIGTAAASGGLFGFFGSIVGQVSKYYQEKQRQSWEREKWQHEETLLKLQMQSRARETENELEIINTEGSWGALGDSYYHDAISTPSYRWVNAVKSCFRPFITVALWLLAAWVFYEVVTGTVTGITATDTDSLVKYMVYSVFFTACTATLWWFGDRALSPPQLKNQ